MNDFTIVFDLDGTLIDTEFVWDEIRRTVARDDGVAWPPEATQAMMGMSTPEWSRYLVETVGFKGRAEDTAHRVIDAMANHYRQGIDVLPGAVAAVRRMAGIAPLALVSSSPRRLIDAALTRLELAEAIAVTVSTEEVAAGKPAPDGYLAACEKLGVNPERAIAIEDATNGIRSALAAGMQVIAVPPHFHPPPQPVLDQCAAVLGTLDELTETLITRIRAA